MIQLSNLSKSFGDQELFSNLDFTLGAGNKVGLVGRNGSGKSTLFKIILGEETPDDGDVFTPKGYRIGALKQYLSFSEPTLREEGALALSGEDMYNYYKVEKILFGLGFSEADLDKDPLSFSGGYQIRINLAKLLVTEPNLLQLDKPTNYLDILSLRWLKSFLKSFRGEVILITHDRDFMDGITTHTMGLVRRNLFIIPGDTHKFYEQVKSNEELYEKEKASQDKKRKELEDFIARNGARASTAAQAQSKVKLLEKMGQMDDLGYDPTLKFDFNYKETPAKVLLEVNDLSFGYTPEKVLFEKISFVLKTGECLAIIGKNGSGKSTLLNTIAGENTPLTGEAAFHSSTTFGHFGQTNISRLDPASIIMDEIYSANPKLSASSVRAICGAMMFSGDRAEKKISLLSGGEKSRVMLGQILARQTNLLFLDEPTHHLDIDSIEALTVAIKNFPGSVIIVTHSEEMLRRVADRLIVFTKEGAEYFDGGYDLFLEKMGWEDEEDAGGKGKKNNAKPGAKLNKWDKKKLRTAIIKERSAATSALKKQVEELEAAIVKAEASLEKNQKALLEVTNKGDTSAITDLSKKVGQDKISIDDLFEKLETAQLELDGLMAEFEAKLEELEG